MYNVFVLLIVLYLLRLTLRVCNFKAFINTYKHKNDEFRRLFKMPVEELLLVDYSCALQREILAHGRVYISLNFVSFRANIIGWETTVSIYLII